MFSNIEFLSELIKANSIFWFCALVGTGMFCLQFIISVFAGVDQDSFGISDSTDGNGHSLDAKNFKWLSLQAITGFLMMFGWTAITCKTEFGFQTYSTILVSLATGIFAAFIIRSIFKYAKKLQSSGSIYRIEDAIGKEAYVYQSIPKDGVGKVSISLQNFTHEIEAVSLCTEIIPSFTRVKIIEKKDDNTVVVTRL
ncbi:MAG: hypothetical protein H0T62_10575 [Parachlamydiaceae bacterium]|nr:hypothetical protein [Parachlamydiaceae bacterium]